MPTTTPEVSRGRRSLRHDDETLPTMASSPLDPPQHPAGDRHEHDQRKRGGKQRRPIVQQSEIGEQAAEQEERETKHRSRKNAKADAALAALEMGERQREHHH